MPTKPKLIPFARTSQRSPAKTGKPGISKQSRESLRTGRFLNQVSLFETAQAATGEIPVENEHLSLEFGLQPPPGVIQAWGARAKFDRNGTIEMVWDRKSHAAQPNVTGKRKKLFHLFIDSVGLRRLQTLVRTLRRDESREVVTSLGRYVIRANPQGSHGYLYISAHEMPLAAGTAPTPSETD